jgi:shikimate dehydrogenase
MTKRRSAIVGSPIGHSLSPVLHQAAYDHLGLDWTYGRHEVTVEQFADFIRQLDPSYRGLSCTMPIKTAICAWGVPNAIVAALGVGNTLVFDGLPGQVEKTTVHNTDVTGMMVALQQAGCQSLERVLIVGAGATATSAAYALTQLGARQGQVMARRREAAQVLIDRAQAWGLELSWCPLTDQPQAGEVAISTIPAPAAGQLAEVIASAVAVVFDVLYNPWPTVLQQTAAQLGRTVISGLELLAHQAVGQVELLTGQTVPAEILLKIGQQTIRQRQNQA